MALRRSPVLVGAILAIALATPGAASAALGTTDRSARAAAILRLARTQVPLVSDDGGGVQPASLCWQRDYHDTVGDAPVDAVAYRLTYDCQSARWQFSVTLAAPFDHATFDSLASEIDTDDNAGNGCDGFDLLLAGVVDDDTLRGVIVATPSCDTSTWTAVSSATFGIDGRSLSLTYAQSSLGGASQLVWNAGVVPKSPTAIVDELPDHGVLVADKFLQQTQAPDGYLLVDAAGGVHAYGNARFRGDLTGVHLAQPIVDIARRDRSGYWLLGRDGGVFTFRTSFYGSTGAMHLNRPVVSMTATHTGHGYWFVAADGGIFSFGDADFYGSTGAMHLNRAVVGMAPTPSGKGYWLVAADGGIFSFGDADFYGSTGAIRLVSPIVGMGASNSGRGYRFAAADGGIFGFGDAGFFGGLGGGRPPSPIVGLA